MSIKSAFARRSGAFAVALLALSFSLGGSYVVRADDPVSTTFLQEIFVDPIVTAVNGLERRLTNLEGTLALFASSFSSQHISARELCVSDDSGAQTCITKAQFDAFLTRQNQARAEVAQPSIIVSDANIEAQAEEGEFDDTDALQADAREIATTAATIELAAASDETAQDDQEPTLTGSIPSPTQGAALVWYPDVEITTSAAPSEE